MSAFKSRISRIVLLALRGTCLAAVLLVSGATLVALVDHRGATAPHNSDDDQAKSGETPATESDRRVVQLDHNAQIKGGIEAVAPTETPYQDLVRAYGTVLALDRLTALYNTSLTDAAQLQSAETRLEASRTANLRAKNLLSVFSTAKAQAESAEAAYELDASGVATAKAQIEALRNTAIQDWGQILGDAIVTRATLATDLVRRKTSLVQISLQPGAVLAPPSQLLFTLGAAAPVEGRFLSEATQIDPKFQSVGYIYAVPATPGLLPGTNVLAYLPKGDMKPGFDIPSTAVVWQAGKPWMYLRRTADTFQRYPIDEAAAPTRDGGYVVPATTLPHDHPVVVAGAQVLLSQEMRAQIPSDEDDN